MYRVAFSDMFGKISVEAYIIIKDLIDENRIKGRLSDTYLDQRAVPWFR